jgi:hypothetical protein
MCLTVSPVEGFTAYDCSNQSNIMEAYSLLEPDACANMGKEGEVEHPLQCLPRWLPAMLVPETREVHLHWHLTRLKVMWEHHLYWRLEVAAPCG